MTKAVDRFLNTARQLAKGCHAHVKKVAEAIEDTGKSEESAYKIANWAEKKRKKHSKSVSNLIAVADELCKGKRGSEKPGHKYHRRSPKSGGGYSYVYEEPESTTCPGCGSENDSSAKMGNLGSRAHYHCRHCGIDYSHDMTPTKPAYPTPTAGESPYAHMTDFVPVEHIPAATRKDILSRKHALKSADVDRYGDDTVRQVLIDDANANFKPHDAQVATAYDETTGKVSWAPGRVIGIDDVLLAPQISGTSVFPIKHYAVQRADGTVEHNHGPLELRAIDAHFRSDAEPASKSISNLAAVAAQMQKSAKGSERAGHKWKTRKMENGHYVYTYDAGHAKATVAAHLSQHFPKTKFHLQSAADGKVDMHWNGGPSWDDVHATIHPVKHLLGFVTHKHGDDKATDDGMTHPKHVIRMGSITEEKYLQRDNSWGDYSTAKKFNSSDDANAHGEKHLKDKNWGIFPTSNPRRK